MTTFEVAYDDTKGKGASLYQVLVLECKTT